MHLWGNNWQFSCFTLRCLRWWWMPSKDCLSWSGYRLAGVVLINNHSQMIPKSGQGKGLGQSTLCRIDLKVLLGLKLWTCILEANDVVTTIQIYSSPCANAPLMQRRSPSWCWRDPRPASSLSSNHRHLVKVDILLLTITTWDIVKFLILVIFSGYQIPGKMPSYQGYSM